MNKGRFLTQSIDLVGERCIIRREEVWRERRLFVHDGPDAKTAQGEKQGMSRNSGRDG